MNPMALKLHGLEIPRPEVESFCARNHIRKLSLFGSILTDRFRPDSDVDVLVEFEPDRVPGFFWSGGHGDGAVRIVGPQG